jgi:hypothetical protein
MRMETGSCVELVAQNMEKAGSLGRACVGAELVSGMVWVL